MTDKEKAVFTDLLEALEELTFAVMPDDDVAALEPHFQGPIRKANTAIKAAKAL